MNTLSYNIDPESQKTDMYLRDFNTMAVFKAMETNEIHSRMLRLPRCYKWERTRLPMQGT